MAIEFDHVILGVGDLDRAAQRLHLDHGLVSVPGGRHPGHGTGNRIIPLGPNYLELMAIVDRAEASESPLGRWVGEQVREGDHLLALCLRTDDLDAVSMRLGIKTHAMSRKKPDGTVLKWRLAGLDQMMESERLPFFIEWEVPELQHPGREAAAHRVRPLGLSWVEWGGDPRRVAEWLGDSSLDLRVVRARSGIHAAGIWTENGEIVLRSES